MSMSEVENVKSKKASLFSILATPYRKLLGEIEDPSLVAWTETFIVSGFIIVFSWLVNPDDMLFLQQDFPWILMAPLFLALRHGFMFGFVSALVFIALAVLMWRMGWVAEEDFSTSVILGMLMVTSLAGEFSDFWQRRLARVEIEDAQRNRRVEEFTRSYHLLRVSHDQLVERLAGSSVSLRQAIASMRQEMLNVESDPLLTEAERVLALFRRYGAVQSASLHLVKNSELDVQALGRLGAVPEGMNVLSQSEIVREALLNNEMITVLAEENGSPRYVDGNILAVVPVSDLSGKIWAMLVIYRIPFLRFTEDNLSLIAVMASYLGDLLSELNVKLQSEESIRLDFHTELKRSIRYARLYGIHAKLVSIQLPKGHPEAFEMLLSLCRSLDKTSTRLNQEGESVALWLMPFSDEFAVAGFQARINLWFKEAFPEVVDSELVQFHAFDINGNNNIDVVMEQVEYACHLSDS